MTQALSGVQKQTYNLCCPLSKHMTRSEKLHEKPRCPRFAGPLDQMFQHLREVRRTTVWCGPGGQMKQRVMSTSSDLWTAHTLACHIVLPTLIGNSHGPIIATYFGKQCRRLKDITASLNWIPRGDVKGCSRSLLRTAWGFASTISSSHDASRCLTPPRFV